MKEPSVDSVDLVLRRILAVMSPRRVVLFGSRARGDARPDSDIDLLIIADSPLPRWKRTVPLLRALKGIEAAVDLAWWTPNEIGEWKDVHSHFVGRALHEGKTLYEDAA